jgi:hypothetical protein
VANVIEFACDRIRHRRETEADLELRITGVVRAGASEVTPASSCDQIRVGDRLIGSYRASGRGDAQLAIRRRPPRPVAVDPRPRPLGLGSSVGLGSTGPRRALGSTEANTETWELDTSNMRPGHYSLSLRETSLELVLADERGETRCHAAVTIDLHLGARARPLACAVAVTG